MTPATNSIHISIQGATAEDVLASARALGGTTATSAIGNDELLAELRERFAKLSPPMVIRVLPFESEANGAAGAGTNDNAGTVKPPTAAEKKAAAKAATDAALAAAAAAAAAKKEDPKATVAGAQAEAGGGDDWDGGADDEKAPTADDVKAALNECSTKNGQAATREIMKEKGGSMRLLDIAADKYPDLIAALKAA